MKSAFTHWANLEAARDDSSMNLNYKVNFPFEHLEGQGEVSSAASAFQREEVELAKLSSYGT